MTDYAPELLVGDPFGEYKAYTFLAGGTITKGDPVILSEDTAPGDISSTPPTVVSVTTSTSVRVIGIAMKSATTGQELPVLVQGMVKLNAYTASDLDAGDSVEAYSNAAGTVKGVVETTINTGFAKSLYALASGDSAIFWVPGGTC